MEGEEGKKAAEGEEGKKAAEGEEGKKAAEGEEGKKEAEGERKVNRAEQGEIFRVSKNGTYFMRELAGKLLTVENVVNAALPWAKKNSSWMRELDKYMSQLHEDPLKKLMQECAAHPLVDLHVKETRVQMQLSDEEWTFLQEDGDPFQDLLGMLNWLVLRAALEFKQKNKPDAQAAKAQKLEVPTGAPKSLGPPNAVAPGQKRPPQETPHNPKEGKVQKFAEDLKAKSEALVKKGDVLLKEAEEGLAEPTKEATDDLEERRKAAHARYMRYFRSVRSQILNIARFTEPS